jgi:hypothetical protein
MAGEEVARKFAYATLNASIIADSGLARRSESSYPPGMAQPKHPPGPPMTLGDMRELGVQKLIAACLNNACRHTALIEVWSYPAATEIMYFKRRVVCAKCGARGNRIDVRPNWREQPPMPTKLRFD